MKALGDHAKSSRQPPVKERKHAKAADDSAGKQDTIDETILENVATHDSGVAELADDVTPQIVAHESSDDSAVTVTSSEGAGEIAAGTLVVAEFEPHTAAGDDSTTQAGATQEDTNAAKRAIIHEWKNWSALHSDELNDPNVAEYFFRHLKQKKTHLLNFGLRNERDIVRALITPPAAIQS
ncbi:MAG TPA: hypothetical protein VFN63_06035 [Pseudolabrys sp.]|nr:hypothetical protein [Pseudolabrys sp.]